MRFNRIAAAVMAGAVVVPSAFAQNGWTIMASGEFDFLFNAFPPPDLDFVGVGDTWTLMLGYYSDVEPDMTSGSFSSFKSSICMLTLVIDDAESDRSASFDLDDFEGGECDLVTTTNPCDCGEDNTVDVVVSNILTGIGLNLNLVDHEGDTLPLFELPTLLNTDPAAFEALGEDSQFEFFMPTSGSTARAISTSMSLKLLEGCPPIPAPGTGALLAFAGLAATRRRR